MRGKLSLIKITTRFERIVSPDFYQLKVLWPHLTDAKAIFWSSAACLSIPCIPSFSLIVFVSTVFVAKHAHHSRYLLQSHSPRSKRHKQVVSSNGAKYYQTGQAYASLRTVWKWQERNAKLMLGSCSIQSSSVRTSSNHSVFCRLFQKNKKSRCVRWVSAYLTSLTFQSSIQTSLQEVL